MVPIERAKLSVKEKTIKHSRGRNIHLIVTKLVIHIGLIKIYVLSGCCTFRRCRTILERGRHFRGRNFDPIVTKFGLNVSLVKLQIDFGDELSGTNRRGRTFFEINFLLPL